MVSKEDFPEIQENGKYRYYIGGLWKTSKTGKTVSVYNPSTGLIFGEVQACSKEEVDEMVKVAKHQQQCWAETPLRERADVINRAAKILEDWAEFMGNLLVEEIAKPKKSAIDEILRTAEIFSATAEAGINLEGISTMGDAFRGYTKGKISNTYRVPLGVILAVGPFNYPVNLTGSKIAPALIAGNSVIMKSATQGSITSLYLGEILKEAGLPPGVFNIITGKGSEIGDYLVSHPGINMVAFTGSTETGIQLAKVAGMKPLLMELGGKDAAIVLDDANLDRTADQIVKGAFSYSGQRCTAVKRVLPMPNIAEALINTVVKKVQGLEVGNPRENKPIGPLISLKQAEFVQSLIDDALLKGATLLVGNKREGCMIWPTVLDHVTLDMRIAWEEPFGPVLPFIRVKTIEEAIEISNKSEYGLQGMVFTENIDLAFNIAQELDVGSVQINAASSRGPDHFPFLGAKSSGLGTQGIRYAIEAMSRPKSIVMNLSERGKLVKKCDLE